MDDGRKKQKREKKEYSFETIETAENLYIYKQKTYEEIARITGVSVVQIQRWSDRYDWRAKKLDYIKRRVGRRKELYEVKDNLILTAKDNTDPQAVYKLAALQRTIDAEERGDPQENAEQKIDRLGVYTEFMRDLVSFLRDHDPDALAALEKSFDEFVAFAKEKYARA